MPTQSDAQGSSTGTSSEQIAAALLKRGEAFGREEPRRLNEELAAYAELIQRFGASEEPTIQKLVAVAMLNKAEARNHQETSSPYAEQLEIYNDLIHRFGESAEPTLQESIAQAMLKKADVLGWLFMPNSLEQIAIYETLIQRFEANSERTIRECVAQAMYERGRALRCAESPRPVEALASFDELIHRFWADVEPKINLLVLQALSCKARWMRCDERPDEAIATCDEVVRYAQLNRHLDQSLDFEAEALRRKGNACVDLTPPRMNEAVALYDEVIERFGHSEDVSLLLEVSMAMLDKARVYSMFDFSAEALVICDAIIARFGGGEDKYIFHRTKVSEAILQKGRVLHSAFGRSEDAIALYDELIEHSDGRWNLRNVFCALFNKGLILIELERLDEASAAYSDLITRFNELRNRHKNFRNDELKKIYEKAVEISSSVSRST